MLLHSPIAWSTWMEARNMVDVLSRRGMWNANTFSWASIKAASLVLASSVGRRAMHSNGLASCVMDNRVKVRGKSKRSTRKLTRHACKVMAWAKYSSCKPSRSALVNLPWRSGMKRRKCLVLNTNRA